MLGLLCYILHQCSLFGYRNEYIQETVEQLNMEIREAKETDVYANMEEYVEMLDFLEEIDPRAETLFGDYIDAKYEYTSYHRNKELELIRKELVAANTKH